MRETLRTLWNLTPLRLAIRLASTGLNLVTLRELITALNRADLALTLIAIAWLIPWEKVALLAYRLIRNHRATGHDVSASSSATLSPPLTQRSLTSTSSLPFNHRYSRAVSLSSNPYEGHPLAEALAWRPAAKCSTCGTEHDAPPWQPLSR